MVGAGLFFGLLVPGFWGLVEACFWGLLGAGFGGVVGAGFCGVTGACLFWFSFSSNCSLKVIAVVELFLKFELSCKFELLEGDKLFCRALTSFVGEIFSASLHSFS